MECFPVCEEACVGVIGALVEFEKSVVGVCDLMLYFSFLDLAEE